MTCRKIDKLNDGEGKSQKILCRENYGYLCFATYLLKTYFFKMSYFKIWCNVEYFNFIIISNLMHFLKYTVWRLHRVIDRITSAVHDQSILLSSLVPLEKSGVIMLIVCVVTSLADSEPCVNNICMLCASVQHFFFVYCLCTLWEVVVIPWQHRVNQCSSGWFSPFYALLLLLMLTRS